MIRFLRVRSWECRVLDVGVVLGDGAAAAVADENAADAETCVEKQVLTRNEM